MAEQWPRLAIATELRIAVTPDQRSWAPGGFGHDHWADYLVPDFPHSLLLARSEPVAVAPDGWELVDGPRATAVPLPPLRPGRRLLHDARAAAPAIATVRPDDALLLIGPGIVASLVLAHALRRRRPFAVQVVGDPLDVAFAAHVGGLAGKVGGVGLAAGLRLACRQAVTVGYVTDTYLQTRYPVGRGTTSFAASNVVLGDGADGPRPPRPDRPPRRLITVGSLEQTYKRVDLLIDAVGHLRAEGWDLTLDVVGDGHLRPDLEAHVGELGLQGSVTFHGMIPHRSVPGLLATADLFVLCSDTEGISRALLEAMSAGLLCIGSSVGGTPELLPPEARFARGSLPSLIGTLRRHLLSPQLRARVVAAGDQRVEAFAPPILQAVRAQFAREVARTARVAPR